MQFIYIITPKRENFIDTITEEEGKFMSIHFGYLKDLLDKGKLIMAGPVLTGEMGIAILETESEQEAQNIMENDPAVKNGVMDCKLYPYRVSLLRGKD